MNNNSTIAPCMPFLLIIGIVLCSIAPPIGLILIVLAIPAQRHFRRRYRRNLDVEIEKARAKLRREKILAAKSLP